MHFDVFNGDADGIIALLQLRLAEPKKSTLITGVKRDISLLQQVDVDKAHSVTVLDISLEKNIDALNALLDRKVDVLYIDHHRSGDIPKTSTLKTLINTDANTCTSLLVNDLLKGAYVNWAIAAAFGDNMTASAIKLAESVGLNKFEQDKLRDLGIYINYNGYGRSEDDLHFRPAELFSLLLNYPDPLTLINEESSVFYQLERAYNSDMAQAETAKVLTDSNEFKAVLLADEAWSRRVSGVFGNELANQAPNKAHAVLTKNATAENSESTYTVSIRAPLNNKQGADEICSQFPTGGGRSGAAGINALPEGLLAQFFETAQQYYSV